MADWCQQLEALGIGSTDVVARIAASEPLPQYPFLPPAERDIRRFEGMSVPGVYRLAVPSDTDASRVVDSIIRCRYSPVI